MEFIKKNFIGIIIVILLAVLIVLSAVYLGTSRNGKDGLNGTNGIDGINGTNGINGQNGQNGTDGQTGQRGTQWTVGADFPTEDLLIGDLHLLPNGEIYRYTGEDWQYVLTLAVAPAPAVEVADIINATIDAVGGVNYLDFTVVYTDNSTEDMSVQLPAPTKTPYVETVGNFTITCNTYKITGNIWGYSSVSVVQTA